ncbi:MAG: 50S ribosomal protein L11 methyltransferase [Deltaproteobacteria bacterium]|nr:50S ribosomal protein L11 methyltransferase [Deltaproteobacteria bacterium]
MKAARKNARLNRAEITVSPRLIEGIRGRFTIVVANILAQDLKRLSAALKDKAAPGGALILSGILREETGPVSEVFTGIGLKPDKSYTQGEWAALVFRKSGGR